MQNVAYLQPVRAAAQQSARASEYRRSLVHDPNFAVHIAADLEKNGIFHALLAISEVDSCAAGALMTDLFDGYIDQMAKKLAYQDEGKIYEMPAQQSLDHYVDKVEAAIATLRGTARESLS